MTMSTIPHHTPPHPPREMRWEYRGTGWQCQHETTYYTVTQEGRAWLSVPQTPRGKPDLHYFEAVPISLPASQTLSTDPKPTIAPEEGKRYVTRDGQVTNPLRPCLSVSYPFKAEVGEFGILHAWTRRGRCDHTSPDPHPIDIVAEYVESPTAEDHAAEPPLNNRSGDPFAPVNRVTATRTEPVPLPYPDHTPPELPSPWHRWEYRGEDVARLEPPWYNVGPTGKACALVADDMSLGYKGLQLHYFQAVPTVPLLQVNGIWFPEPLREGPAMGRIFFIAVPDYKTGWREVNWLNDEHDNRWLAAGLVHLTPEAAAAHSKAMLSLAAKGGDQ